MSLEKERKSIVDNQIAELTSTINDAHTNIVTETKNSKMPMGVFIKFFLPFFNGTEQLTKDNSIIFKWIEYAGSVHSAVDLVDERGDVVDTIPPLANSVKLSEEASTNLNMSREASIMN
jgi:hypothetical protein